MREFCIECQAWRPLSRILWRVGRQRSSPFGLWMHWRFQEVKAASAGRLGNRRSFWCLPGLQGFSTPPWSGGEGPCSFAGELFFSNHPFPAGFGDFKRTAEGQWSANRLHQSSAVCLSRGGFCARNPLPCWFSGGISEVQLAVGPGALRDLMGFDGVSPHFPFRVGFCHHFIFDMSVLRMG